MDEYFFFIVGRKILGRKNLYTIIEPLNILLRNIASISHVWQHRLEWGGAVAPEWFNHYGDQYWQWHAKQNPLWLERGIFSLLTINPGARVLELCCGDGFNSYHFYSIRAKIVEAIDFSQDAIVHAKKYNKAKNITYHVKDIRKGLPKKEFDNVVWDAAIEHFTQKEISEVIRKIKNVLVKKGVLSGYTVLENESGQKMHPLHEYEFKTREDLARFFTPFFKNVKVFETDYPSRKNLYFFASDGTLPFDNKWKWLAKRSK